MAQPMHDAPPQMRRPPEALYRIINPTFKLLLHSPLHSLMSQRLMVLHVHGRKSGKRYSIPVGYTQINNTLLVPTQAGWKANFIQGANVLVRLRGQNRSGRGTLIRDEAGMYDALRQMLTLNPQLSQIMGIRLDAAGQPLREDVVRARQNGYVVVRIELEA